MDAALRTRLTRLGCTQAHLDLFVHNELYTVSDVQGLQDIDLENIGLKLGTRRRVLEEFGAKPSPASGGGAGPGQSRPTSSMFSFASDPAAAASAQAAPAAAPPPPPKAAPAAAAPAAAVEAPREKRVKMTRMRLKIAQRLKEAQNEAAMLTTFNEVDMSGLTEMRTEYKDAFLKRRGSPVDTAAARGDHRAPSARVASLEAGSGRALTPRSAA